MEKGGKFWVWLEAFLARTQGSQQGGGFVKDMVGGGNLVRFFNRGRRTPQGFRVCSCPFLIDDLQQVIGDVGEFLRALAGIEEGFCQ